MAINPEVVGKKIEGEPFAYDEDTVILYALGIGAGLDEINFIYEKDLKVFPTFAVIPFMPSLIPLATEANLNMFTVLHGEQKIILHKEIPTKGSLISTAVCSSVYDKGATSAAIADPRLKKSNRQKVKILISAYPTRRHPIKPPCTVLVAIKIRFISIRNLQRWGGSISPSCTVSVHTVMLAELFFTVFVMVTLHVW